MFQLKFQWFLLLFCVLLIPGSAFGQIAIHCLGSTPQGSTQLEASACVNPSSAKITNDPNASVEYQVVGISPGTGFTPSLIYPGKASGWASITQISGTTITVTLNGNFPVTTDNNEQPPTQNNQGTYQVYLVVQVGVVTYKASLLVYLFPTDNQFLFTNSSGQPVDINGQNGGLILTTSAPNQSINILYASLSSSTPQMENFQLAPDPNSRWLSVSPMSGHTPANGVVVSANPSGLQPSATPYVGSIGLNAPGAPNQNAALPVYFYVQGTQTGQQLPTDNTQTGFSYGSTSLNNGASGFIVQVPSANAQLTVSAAATQPIQIYARYGSDVAPNGSSVIADAASSQGVNPSLMLGPGSSPALQAGTWYIAIQTSSNQLTTGYIGASLTQVQAPCTYSLSSTSASLGTGAGGGSFTLSTQGGCFWSASSDSTWLRINGSASSTGTATIGYTYDANTGPGRTGNISAGGLTFTVTQASGQPSAPQIQSFTATPSSISYGASATLSWSVVGAASISLDNGIGGVPSSGNYVVTPGRTRTYTLFAQNSGGSNSGTTIVTVAGQPPSGQQILTATPNPVLVTSGSLGMTNLNWSAPGSVQSVELHVNAPNGPLLTGGGQSGTAQTGQWVPDGMTFYLQDVTGGKPLTVANTLDTVTVRVIPANASFFSASPLYVASGQSSGTVLLTWNAPGVSRVQIWVLSASGAQMTGDLPSTGWTFSGNWAQEGMPFYLQNSTSGSGKGDSNTLRTTRVSADPVPSP